MIKVKTLGSKLGLGLAMLVTFTALTGNCLAQEPATPKSSTSVKLRIVHVNDVHGHVEPLLNGKISPSSKVGGIPYLRTVVEECRQENPSGTLVLNAGDLAEGTMLSYLTKGKSICAALKAFRFDAVTLGNHDFAWGQPALKEMLLSLDSPVLLANVRTLENGGLFPTTQAYLIKELQGVRVGIIGLDTPEIRHFVAQAKLSGLEFTLPQQTVQWYLPLMRKAGAQVIVVLSHLGYDEDVKLARAVPGIDVIVGGHSHTRLEHGAWEGSTLIVQAGALTQFVGVVDMEVQLGSEVKILSKQAKLIPVIEQQVKPDPQVERILAPYVEQCEQVGSEVVASCSEDVYHGHREALKLNQVHADSLLAATRSMGVQFGICNSRSMRGNLSQGNVTYRELYSSLPFTEENYVTMTVTGQAVLNEIEDDLRDRATELAVPTGLSYVYDPALPEGHRLVSVTLANGEKLEPGREYLIVLNETMSRKRFFAQAKQKIVHGPVQPLYFQAIKEGSPWKNNPDDRVQKI